MAKNLLVFLFLVHFSFLKAQQVKLILPIGHTDYLTCEAFSPDGKLIATGSADNTVKIWNVKTGLLITNINASRKAVRAISFSPDGKKIATFSDYEENDNFIKIWDVESGLIYQTLRGHQGEITSAHFSKNGRTIISSSSWDSTCKLWNVGTGSLIHNFKNHSGNLINSIFSQDESDLLTISKDKALVLTDIETGKERIYRDRSFYVKEVQCSQDGTRYFGICSDDIPRIWDSKHLNQLAIRGKISGVIKLSRFSNDGKKVALLVGSTIIIKDCESGEVLSEIETGNFFNSLSSDPNLNLLFSAPDNNRVILYNCWDDNLKVKLIDIKSQKTIFEIDKKIHSTGMAFFATDLFFTIKISDTLKIYNPRNGELVSDIKINGNINTTSRAKFSPDGQYIVSVGSNNVNFLNTRTGIPISVPNGRDHFNNIEFDSSGNLFTSSENGVYLKNIANDDLWLKYITLSKDGYWIRKTSLDSTAKMWDTKTGKLLNSINDSLKWLTFARFLPDGKKMAVPNWNSSYRGLVKFWDIDSQKTVLETQKLEENFELFAKSWDESPKINCSNNILINNDGKRMVTVSQGTVLWDVETGKKINRLGGDFAQFSPDGDLIVTTGNDHLYSQLKIFDGKTGQFLYDLKGRQDMNYANFSPDGKKIISCGFFDNTPMICDVKTQKESIPLIGHDSYVTSAEFSPDGRRVVTTSWDGTEKIWDSESGELLLTLVFLDGTDYLVVDRYNRYDGTENAKKLIYFVCGTEVINLDQLKGLWVPGLAQKILNGDTVNAPKLSELNICGLTPIIENSLDSTNGIYTYKIIPQKGGIGQTVLSINNREQQTFRPEELTKTSDGYELKISKNAYAKNIIPGEENKIALKSYTEKGNVSSKATTNTFKDTNKNAGHVNLYAIMVGISDYRGDTTRVLKFAPSDAIALAKTISKSSKNFLDDDGKEHVFVYTVSTVNGLYPYKPTIKKLLEDSIGSRAKPQDILMIFLSGHGKVLNNEFLFETAESSPLYPIGISTKELLEWTRPILAAKRLLIMDVCKSGQFLQDLSAGSTLNGYYVGKGDEETSRILALAKLRDQSGMFILAAAASNQVAYQFDKYQHGVLTYALLKSIKEDPGILANGNFLDVQPWFAHSAEMVQGLLNEAVNIGIVQQPRVLGVGSESFRIGVVNDEVVNDITLPITPTFSECNFQIDDANIAADTIGLNKKINQHLFNYTSKGPDTQISFNPLSKSSDSYSLSGRYLIKGKEIAVRANIWQNNKLLFPFQIVGNKENLNEFAEKIATTAIKWVLKKK